MPIRQRPITRLGSRLIAAVLLLLTCNAATLAVGGTAPPTECGKTLVFARSLPGSPVPGATSVAFGAVVFFELTGDCIPGPYSLSATLEIDCGPLGVLSNTINTNIGEGFTSLPFVFDIPPTAPTTCTIQGEATVTFLDGTATRALLAPADYCFARENPLLPGQPLLQIERLTSSAAFAHPGDQVDHVIRIINNGNQDFEGTFTAVSSQRGRLPVSVAAFEGNFVGPFANSGPISGENFPIALPQHLGVDGCVILSPNPHSSQMPALIENLLIPPGQSVLFDISSRSWPLTARGNMSEIDISVDGMMGPLPVVGCAGFIAGADTQIPPTYDCVDSGAAALISPLPTDALLITVEPTSGTPVDSVLDLVNVQINRFGDPPISISEARNSTALTANHGRIRSQIQRASAFPLFLDTDTFELVLEYQLRTPGFPPNFPAIISLETVPNAPSGFETRFPYAIGRVDLATDGSRGMTGTMEFIYQLSLNALTVDKTYLPVDILDLQMSITPTGFTARALATASGARGSSSMVMEIEARGDARAAGGGGLGHHTCPGDVSGDGHVDFVDLNEVLANWGATVPPKTNGDADGDTDVDFDDLNIVLNYWGTSC